MSEGSDHAGQPLNINGDTAAGALANAMGAQSVVFLTDVAGVMDNGGRVIPRLTARTAEALRESGVARGRDAAQAGGVPGRHRRPGGAQRAHHRRTRAGGADGLRERAADWDADNAVSRHSIKRRIEGGC